jgi:hypothetical protein
METFRSFGFWVGLGLLHCTCGIENFASMHMQWNQHLITQEVIIAVRCRDTVIAVCYRKLHDGQDFAAGRVVRVFCSLCAIV